MTVLPAANASVNTHSLTHQTLYLHAFSSQYQLFAPHSEHRKRLLPRPIEEFAASADRHVRASRERMRCAAARVVSAALTSSARRRSSAAASAKRCSWPPDSVCALMGLSSECDALLLLLLSLCCVGGATKSTAASCSACQMLSSLRPPHVVQSDAPSHVHSHCHSSAPVAAPVAVLWLPLRLWSSLNSPRRSYKTNSRSVPCSTSLRCAVCAKSVRTSDGSLSSTRTSPMRTLPLVGRYSPCASANETSAAAAQGGVCGGGVCVVPAGGA